LPRVQAVERATQAACGEGNSKTKVVLVGEQPGDQEDLAGKPSAGPAGRVLDDALQKAGVARKDVYITRAVKHFSWERRGKRRIRRRRRSTKGR
jgi:DNA polymerase